MTQSGIGVGESESTPAPQVIRRSPPGASRHPPHTPTEGGKPPYGAASS